MFPACETRIDKKYGKWGRVLGKGTGGTVRLIQGPPRLGGKVFAVKEFRKKKGKETDFEYRRMITAECCFANGLKHVNVIETVDIVRNKSRYFQVMEYAPYDLFSVVMSGRMVQPEIYCVFRQICDGVAYLHSTGLAHRDLKLENCVMTNGNVVKLIDFGTATPSYHPDKGVILSSGLVGSDPYVAPEVFRGEMYDARKADVWSLGIIFLSMMLRRFPWALADPRKDLNYRKFATTLHELPARPASPRKAASATLAPSTTGATTSSTEPAPRKPKAQKSGESMVESSASSAYEVPSLFGFGASGGGLSLTTFATRDSSLVLTPSDTSASRASRTTDEQNWVDPYLEKYENWEAVIERLCAEREEESSAGSSARSSRSSVRAPKSVPSSTRLSSFIQSPAPAWVPNGSGSGSGNGSTSESAAGSGVASSSASTRAPTAHVAAMSALAHGNGLAPQNQIRHEASEPMLSTLARPSPALLSTNRRARPPILATVSDNVLCDTLHTSPIASSPPAASAAAPTPASGGPGPVSAHSFASEPTLISGLYPAQGLSKLYDAAPSPTPAGRIVISPDNTLSYLPHETRWTILRMLQIEPASRCSMADILCCPPQSQQQQQQALPPSPPQSPPRSSAASTHEGQAHAHLPHQLPSALQMTPAKRAATMPAGAGAGAGAGTIGRKRGDRDPGIEELGRDWLRNIVPCSDTDCECATHIHVRLKPSTKAGVVSGNGKWWKRS